MNPALRPLNAIASQLDGKIQRKGKHCCAKNGCKYTDSMEDLVQYAPHIKCSNGRGGKMAQIHYQMHTIQRKEIPHGTVSKYDNFTYHPRKCCG